MSDLVTILEGDCLARMRELPDESVHCVVSSPPYFAHGRAGQDGNGMRMPTKYANIAGANLRTVWRIASKPFPGAHFATFPPQLANICVRAGTSAMGACASCGTPWRRKTKVVGKATNDGEGAATERKIIAARDRQGASGAFVTGEWNVRETVGWEPTCKCGVAERVPCVVLDPFGGTFTTAMEAVTLGRRAIVCEINPEYIELGRQRLGLFAPRAHREPAEPIAEEVGT